MSTTGIIDIAGVADVPLVVRQTCPGTMKELVRAIADGRAYSFGFLSDSLQATYSYRPPPVVAPPPPPAPPAPPRPAPAPLPDTAPHPGDSALVLAARAALVVALQGLEAALLGGDATAIDAARTVATNASELLATRQRLRE